MKKQLLLGVAFGALTAVSPATAQPPAPIYSWTGFYIGANAGYSWGHGAFTYTDPALGSFGLPTVSTGTQSLNGAIGGFQFGYNYQPSPSWVMGVETDFVWSGEKGSNNFSYPLDSEGVGNISGNITAKINSIGTVRGRFGPLITPTLWLYVTSGLAYGSVHVAGTFTDTTCSPTCSWSFSQTQTRFGAAVGAGAEGAISSLPGWTWKVEYLYVDLGTINGTGFDTDFGGPIYFTEKVTDNIFRAGINYRIP